MPWIKRLVQLALGGTGLGLAAATWLHTVSRLESSGAGFVQVALFVMPFWYLWAALVPAVLWMAHRHPARPDALATALPRHAALAVFLAFAHSALRFSLQPQLRASLEANTTWDVPLGPLWAFATFEAPVHLFIYGAIVGVACLVDYARRLRSREVAAAQLATQLAQAQVQALRMQLNPHFLFNALNGVAMLIRSGGSEQAVRMIAGLSDLLRYVLDEAEEPEVSVREDLEFVRQYLEIEQIRFSHRLTVRVEVDPDTADALVPTLLLQPIVENAVRHGVAGTAGAACVSVTASKRDGSLELRVVDDGPGLSHDPGNGVAAGKGIKNTRSRLARLYGENQSLEIENLSPRGVAVTITLPFRRSTRTEPEA